MAAASGGYLHYTGLAPAPALCSLPNLLWSERFPSLQRIIIECPAKRVKGVLAEGMTMRQHSASRTSNRSEPTFAEGATSPLRGSLRNKIIAWSFVPTAIILVTVTLVSLYAYQRVTENLVMERDRELTRLSARLLATELSALDTSFFHFKVGAAIFSPAMVFTSGSGL